MDIGEVAPEGSTVDGLLFLDYGRFQFRGKKAGVLLCMGITAQEKQACLGGKTDSIIAALKAKNVYPYTDMERESVT